MIKAGGDVRGPGLAGRGVHAHSYVVHDIFFRGWTEPLPNYFFSHGHNKAPGGTLNKIINK